MKKTYLIILLFVGLRAFSQPFPYAVSPDFDQNNNIRSYLGRVASEITHNSLSNINNLNDWEAVKDQKHTEFLEMMGLQGKPFEGKRSPLNVTKTGVIQKEGYRIEKLYYESLPGLYVPANLYIPEGIKKPVPAVLYVCGHSHTQKHHYQAHARSFAQNGFVVLIIETIQRGEVKGEHLGAESLGWFHWYSMGYNPGGVEIWNGIRGLDLLSELPEVDKNRLGVTGISGGGSQSWYLPAADPRIKAAAAVAGAGSLEGQICQKSIDDHCDCMMPINTYGIDFTDIGALIAPRPFMIAQTTQDQYYSIEAVRTLHEKIKPVYNWYDKPENLMMMEAGGGHSYGSKEEFRPIILSFFMQELMGKKVSPENLGPIDVSKELSNEELAAFVNGVPPDDKTKTIQETFVEAANPPVVQSREQLEQYRSEVVGFLKEKTFGAFPKKASSLDIRLDYRYANKQGSESEVYSFVPEDGWRLKLELKKGQPTTTAKPVVLVLKNPNAARWSAYGLTSGLPENTMVATFEARGIGDTGWAPGLQWHVRRAAAWTGRTVASMRVYDVLRCLEVLRQLPGVDIENISIIAEGEMAAIASYACLMDEKVKSLWLKNPPATQNAPGQPDGTGMAIEMLNCLRITDVPQVTGLMYPRELVAIGEWPASYDWVKQVYETLENSAAFREIEKISEWKSK
ncbi:MAG: alpha/beta hydrolase family protein [Cyclobacteriaceae bacterium]